MPCFLTPTTGGVIVRTPYDAGFVSALKAQIPFTDRKYNDKTWTISTQYVAKVAHLIERHFGEKVTIPAISKTNPSVMKLLDVRYIGGCKDRQDGTITASGWSGGQWSVIFPESVLRAWFEATPDSPTVNSSTLYSVLGARMGMTADELKTAYRRCALQWHPDVSKDLDAPEIFLKIQHAWEVLSSPRLRERYDAGLALEASLGKQPRTEYQPANFYRSPLKSGLIMCTGKETIGRFIVERVHEWLDITDAQGRTLVTSWVMGQDTPVEIWA